MSKAPESLLQRFRDEKRAAFIPFLVAGDPSIEATERVVDILVEEGADLLELGVPFSDAMADGPVIQAASERASKVLGSMGAVLDLAARIHAKHPRLPLILFTYYNPIFRLGVAEFARRAQVSGVSGVLVVDLPPEESKGYRETLDRHGLKTVFLASPTTAPERLGAISDASTGFVYYVSRTGVTGVQKELSATLAPELARLREKVVRPIAVGFGISTAEQARAVARLGDAVVVGSAFVKLMAEPGELSDVEKRVRVLARELVAAVRSVVGSKS
jgi:tryptophan synthase alpha chain